MTSPIAAIWRPPAYLPYLQPALTPAAISAAEDRLGVTLPSSYLALLREQNGGYVRLTCPDTPHEMIWGVGPHFPNIEGPRYWQDPDFEGDIWRPVDHHLIVPFDGDGHWHLCFDYRERGPAAEPSVLYLDLECEREQAIAGGFDAFLAMLEPPEDADGLGIVDERPIERVVEDLNRALGIGFDSADANAHGYMIYRWPLLDGWLWLSPNRVPRGFVRPSDGRYAELVDALPGTALRFPDHPDVRFILSSTDMRSALAVCARLNLAARPVP